MNYIRLIFTFALLSLFTTSCNDEYITVGTDDFNESIASNQNILTPEDLIKEYYFGEREDSNTNIVIEVEEVKNGIYIINLIEDNIEDDSIKAIKIMMIAHKIEDTWTVYEILKSMKCRRSDNNEWTKEICK